MSFDPEKTWDDFAAAVGPEHLERVKITADRIASGLVKKMRECDYSEAQQQLLLSAALGGAYATGWVVNKKGFL